MTKALPNSPPKYAAPLEIRLEPCAAPHAASGLLHGAAATGVLVSALPLPLAVAALLLIAASAYASAEAILRYRVLRWRVDGVWELTDRFGRTRIASLRGDSIVAVPACVLLFAPHESPRERVVIVVAAGGCDPGTLRRLRVRLRLESGVGERVS